MPILKSQLNSNNKGSPLRKHNQGNNRRNTTAQGSVITGPTDRPPHPASKKVIPSEKIIVDAAQMDTELDAVDMSLNLDMTGDSNTANVEMTDMLNRSLGDRTKRRSRSDSPSRETKTRTQHTQDIRSALSIQFGRRDEERASKFQGVGSPSRGKLDNTDLNSVSISNATSGDNNSSSHGVRTNGSTSSTEDHESITGVLYRTKIFLSGTFDVDLEDLRTEIIENGGKVSKILSDDVQLMVIGDNPKRQDIEVQKQLRTRWITLKYLREVIEGRASINDISATSGKVSFDMKGPLSFVHPYTPKQSKPTSRTVFPPNFPARIPINRPGSPQTPSTLTNRTLHSPQEVSIPGKTPLPALGKKVVKFKYTTIITTRMRFSQAEKPDEAIHEAVKNLLTVFKDVDPAVKFRHLERDDRVYASTDDVPPLRYMYDTMAYFNGAKPASLQPYSNPKEDRMRNVNFTLRVGSSLPMKEILDGCS